MFPLAMVLVVAAVLSFAVLVPDQNLDLSAPLDESFANQERRMEVRAREFNAVHGMAVSLASNLLDPDTDLNGPWPVHTVSQPITMSTGTNSLQAGHDQGALFIPATLAGAIDDTLFAARYVWVPDGADPAIGSGYVFTYPVAGALTDVQRRLLNGILVRESDAMAGMAFVRADGSLRPATIVQDRNPDHHGVPVYRAPVLPVVNDPNLTAGSIVRFSRVKQCFTAAC